MEFTRTIEINNDIEGVWQVLGKDFAHPHKWASTVYHSEGHGKPVASISCNERFCDTAMGQLKEKLVYFSDAEHSLSITIVEGLPKPIKKGGSTWTLKPLTDGRTLLQLEIGFEFKGWAKWMQPLMSKKLGRMASDLTGDLAHYVEKGKPHPRKINNDAAHQAPRHGWLKGFYFLAFLVGTLVPLYFVYGFIQEKGSVDLTIFIADLFSTKASSTFSSDLLISSFIFWVFMAYDKKSRDIPNRFIFVLLNLTIGLSCALPLYLFFREKQKS